MEINKKLEKQIIEVPRKKGIQIIRKKLKITREKAVKLYDSWRYFYVREIKYPHEVIDGNIRDLESDRAEFNS